ncbi:unnamed protein product [Urochloa decumbens]|uniref:Uncharacterized protein n=1 Tax=Urochloa decumbens TaxID=240449 RepID=A0ABC9FEX0_9POAL
MAPSSMRLRLAVIIFAVLAAVFLAGAGVATAARPAPGGGGGEEVASSYLQLQVMDPAAAAVEKAMRDTVEMLMARLPAGPSPRGPGH